MTGDAALILIVDDDYDFLEINRMILERAGYRVVTAPNPSRPWQGRRGEAGPGHHRSDDDRADSGFSLAGSLKDDPRTRMCR